MEDERHDETQKKDLHNPETGLRHGVPPGVAEEDSAGLPNSDRHQTESHPIHPDRAHKP